MTMKKDKRAWKAIGRPTKNPRTEQIGFRLSPAELADLQLCADAMGRQRVEAVVEGIKLLKKKLGITWQRRVGDVECYLTAPDISKTYGEMPELLRECIEGDADRLRRLVEVIQLHGRTAEAGYPYEMLRLLARELFEAWRRAQHDIPEEREERVVLAVELYARGYRDQILPDRSGWRVDVVRDRMKGYFDAIAETLGRDAKDFALFYDTERLLALGDLWESRWHDAHKDEWPM